MHKIDPKVYRDIPQMFRNMTPSHFCHIPVALNVNFESFGDGTLALQLLKDPRGGICEPLQA